MSTVLEHKSEQPAEIALTMPEAEGQRRLQLTALVSDKPFVPVASGCGGCVCVCSCNSICQGNERPENE
ncbi:hypothetical protein AB0M47_40285 [Hamadaea sp. NPDC051192]|uniref:hypothetical protein n=1 Tax=Hamadaea sp. NPDC051192 TaxID=3154940 RepID=UPI00341AC848